MRLPVYRVTYTMDTCQEVQASKHRRHDQLDAASHWDVSNPSRSLTVRRLHAISTASLWQSVTWRLRLADGCGGFSLAEPAAARCAVTQGLQSRVTAQLILLKHYLCWRNPARYDVTAAPPAHTQLPCLHIPTSLSSLLDVVA